MGQEAGDDGAGEKAAQTPIRRGRLSPTSRVAKARGGAAVGDLAEFPVGEFLEFCGRLKIQSRDYGLVDFELVGSQTYILEELMQGLRDGVAFFVFLKSRQLGASTFFLALDLFWAFKHAGILGVFATHDEGSREQFRAQIDLYLNTLPKSHRISDATNNRTMLVLKNASLFRYLVAGSRTTTNKMGRSGGTNYAHMTEVAFWGSADDLVSLQQTFSSVYPHRLYIAESTANGFNHFEELWQTAKANPSMRAVFVGWWRDERNEFGEGHPSYRHYMPGGTKEPLTERERRGVREVKRQYGVDINAGQIAWYRWHLAVNCKGDPAQMDQEQPWTEEDAFQSTGSRFFTNDALTQQFREARKVKCLPMAVSLGDKWQQTVVKATRIDVAPLKIWEEPSPWGKYTIGCDPAFGSSPGNDYTAISVWRVWADRAWQVAEYASPETSTYQCAWVLAYLAGLYRDVTVNLEINGPGMVVMQELDRLRRDAHDLIATSTTPDLRNVFAHMKEFLYRRSDSLGGGVMRQWKTTGDTKPVLMNRFKNYVDLGMAWVRSLATIEECRRLRVDGGWIEAETGHDDRAIAAALAVYAWAEYRMPELKARNWTVAHADKVEAQGGESAMSVLWTQFMKERRITVKEPLP